MMKQDIFFTRMNQDEQNVGTIENLDQFISKYQNQNLIPTLFQLYQQYQYHRRIKGDGNCFYRSFAFLYLLNKPLNKFQSLFPKAPIINCQNLPFRINSQEKAYQMLSKLWNKLIKPLAGSSKSQISKQLRIIFNEYRYVDQFLVAYFRSLNYKYIMQHRRSLQAFVQQQFEVKSNKILKYSQQAEFFQILNLSNCLNIRFTIMMVHEAILKKIIINQHLSDNYLFFLRPGHYEILCSQDQYKNQRQHLRSKQSSNKKFLQLQQKFKDRKTSYDEKKINSHKQVEQLIKQTKFQENQLYNSKVQSSKFTSQNKYDQKVNIKAQLLSRSPGSLKSNNYPQKQIPNYTKKPNLNISSMNNNRKSKQIKTVQNSMIVKKQNNIGLYLWLSGIILIIILPFVWNNNIS